jgi:hypothetical protein
LSIQSEIWKKKTKQTFEALKSLKNVTTRVWIVRL